MPHINLYGSNGKNTVEIPVPTRKGSVEIPTPTPENLEYHKDATFAALHALRNDFRHAEICDSDFWDMKKAELGVTSQKEIAEPVWALLWAEVNTARNDKQAFQRLVLQVKAFRSEKPPVIPPADDSLSLLFAEPDEPQSTCFVMRRDRSTSEDTLSFIGEYSEDVRSRCQEEANETRCIVRLYHNGQKPEAFHPETNGNPCPF